MTGTLWIETNEDLLALGARLGPDPLAIDTEADSFHHYKDKVCLVQIACGGAFALVDPLGGVDLGLLAAPLADAGLPKLLHGADYDVRMLHRDFGLTIENLFDTMIAARLAGERSLGLAALLEAHLGVRVDKSHQRADWSRRPLTAEMMSYAIEDVRHLDELASRLAARLTELGRLAWAQEECARVASVRWRDRRAEDPEPFRRIKGAASLPPRALAILRELWTWRDTLAERRDRPAFRVLRDEVLVVLAQTPPATIGELAGVRGIAESMKHSQGADELFAAVRRGVLCPEGELPARKGESRPQPDPRVDAAAARLRASRDRVAVELGLDPAVVASRGLIDEVARRMVAGEDDPWAFRELRAWQVMLLRPVAP